MIDQRGLMLDQWIQRACALLAHEEPEEGYHGCFSGGKDSVVIKELARIAGVKVRWYYYVTTIDPPEVTRFIRLHHPDVRWVRPEKPFFALMPEKVPPSRRIRWCCERYKERTPVDETAIIGVRVEESSRRRNLYTRCVMDQEPGRSKRVLPIRLWSEADVWEFIRSRNLPYCELYDEGFKRIGCIGCPMTNPRQRKKEFERWPSYERLWRQSFRRFWDRKKQKERDTGNPWIFGSRFQSADEMFAWCQER